MCAKPTLAAERAAALAAGWSAADIRWEQLQEQAATLYSDGDVRAADECWREGLQLAQRHFDAADPRLATSLANAAAAQDKKTRLESAREIWRHSPLWIDRIVPASHARSSSHHFRMEKRHREVYRHQARRALHDAAAQARALLDGQMQRSPAQQLAQWKKEKPPTFSGSRKLLAACFLLLGHDR